MSVMLTGRPSSGSNQKSPLEKNYGLKEDEIIDVLSIITKRKKEIIDAWHKHFTD